MPKKDFLAHQHLPKCHVVCTVLCISQWIQSRSDTKLNLREWYQGKIHMDLSRGRLCVVFEWTLLLYSHNWWSLHWSFVWRLRQHEEGLDWSYMNKDRSGVGEHTFAWSSAGGWVAHRGQARGKSNNPSVWGLFHARQDGGWSQIWQDNTLGRGKRVTSGTYRAPQLRLRSAQVTSCDRH